MMSTMSALRVRVLGGLVVEGVEQPALGSRKQRRLLARLVVARGAALSADALADDLWRDAQPANPRDQLSVLVSRLRSVLPDGAVTRQDAGYAVVTAWSDLEALSDLSREAQRRAGEDQWAAAAAAARSALALVRGPLLPEHGDTAWVSLEQQSVDRETQAARLVLAQAELSVGDPRLAADVARAALQASPYDEVALRLHLNACLAARSPALGLATYAATRTRLADDLGVDPTRESRAAYERLLNATGEEPIEPLTASAPPGRQRELGRVMRAIDHAAHGGSALVVLTGEPGIGKSRLLLATAQATRHLVIRATCDELGRVLPLQPVLDGLAAVLRLRTPAELAVLLGHDTGLLSPLLGLQLAPGRGPGLPDGGTGQVLLQAAVVRLLERLAGSGAVVLLVEDAHLADAATLALLAGVESRATRVVAVLAARSGVGPTWPERVTIELGPLDLAAVTEVVGSQRAAALHRRSGGHPLLLSELVEHGDEALPDTLRAVFAAAAASAGRAGATLMAASIVGPELDLDVLAQVLRRPAVELLDDLEVGVRRRLLVEQTSGFAFRHGLVREALAAAVGPTRAALLHRETARALAGRPGADPLVLADHARAGGLPQIAADAWAEAAAIAANRHAHDESLRLAESALLAQPDHVGGTLLRARALLALGSYPAAAVAAAAAVQLGAGGAAQQVGALAAHYQRDWATATELADTAAGQAEDETARALALTIGAHVRHAAGDVPGAERRFAAAGDGVTQAGHTSTGWLALLRHHQGRSDETVALTEHRDAASRGLDQLAIPLVQMSRGLALAALARPAQALACFDAMDEVVERLGLARYAGRADNCRGHVYRNLGLFELADERNETAREAAARVDVDEPVAHALLDLAEGRLRAGDLDGVVSLLDQAAEYAGDDRRHGFQWRQRLRAGWLRGRAALAAGDVQEAGNRALAVVQEAAARDAGRYDAFGRVLALQVRVAEGKPPTPEEALRVLDALSGVAGMERLWLTAEVAAQARGGVQRALVSRAEELGDVLVAGSPLPLQSGVRAHVQSLLS